MKKSTVYYIFGYGMAFSLALSMLMPTAYYGFFVGLMLLFLLVCILMLINDYFDAPYPHNIGFSGLAIVFMGAGVWGCFSRFEWKLIGDLMEKIL